MSVVAVQPPLAAPVQRVGIAEAVCTRTGTLVTHGLGSCIAFAVYDPRRRAAGLLHCLLPDSTQDRERARRRPETFVDSGFERLFWDVGGSPDIVVTLIGGAAIEGGPQSFAIGAHNIAAARAVLTARGLEPRRTDVGGHEPRTAMIDATNGAVWVKSPGRAPYRV